MRIVKPSVTLEWITPDALRVIERAGRTCYKSDDRITETSAATFCAMIAKRGHESVIEHASASARIVCDRGVSHEIVRHRIASYSQESTRYCNYSSGRHGAEIAVIEPPGLDAQQRCSWAIAMETAEGHYFSMIEDGCSPQIARSVLPTALKTELVMTCNFREWLHFLKLRTAPEAHPQMREVAELVRAVLAAAVPEIFGGAA